MKKSYLRTVLSIIRNKKKMAFRNQAKEQTNRKYRKITKEVQLGCLGIPNDHFYPPYHGPIRKPLEG
jgi:hypothetical protein